MANRCEDNGFPEREGSQLRRGRGASAHKDDQDATSSTKNEEVGEKQITTVRSATNHIGEAAHSGIEGQIIIPRGKGVSQKPISASADKGSGEGKQAEDEGSSGEVNVNAMGIEGGGEIVMETEERSNERQDEGKYSATGGWGENQRELIVGSGNMNPQKPRRIVERKGWKRRARENSKTHNNEEGTYGGQKRRRETYDIEEGAIDRKHPRYGQEFQDKHEKTAAAAEQPRRTL